jgi:glycosyltransferase involved in cell wall biosynthesis
MAADVMAELLKSYPDAELCMVGPNKDGSMAEFRDYIWQQGYQEHVKITGKLLKEEWIRLSEDYDFFINTTNVDNTPVSVIEAMALGLCVISTDPGGIPYLLNDGTDSFLVKSSDYSAMADRISQLLNNHCLAASLSEAARLKAESFDWNKVRLKWGQILG